MVLLESGLPDRRLIRLDIDPERMRPYVVISVASQNEDGCQRRLLRKLRKTSKTGILGEASAEKQATPTRSGRPGM
jgi:hypothetical protein